MVSDDARKKRARDLARRTGMKYTAALRHVTTTAGPREPRYRWVLTDEVRAFFAGATRHGAYFEDLYDWLDRLSPEYECDWCAEPGDARTRDSSIQLAVTAYDPDLSPAGDPAPVHLQAPRRLQAVRDHLGTRSGDSPRPVPHRAAGQREAGRQRRVRADGGSAAGRRP